MKYRFKCIFPFKDGAIAQMKASNSAYLLLPC